MIYHIVAGEEMKNLLKNRLKSIPFNEDMSKGAFTSEPFSNTFVEERSLVHGVTTEEYISNMSELFTLISKVKEKDIIHLYFGDDEVCLANRGFLINYFKDKVDSIYFHLMNEYEGIELSVVRVK